jgi:hypothetical protein
MGLVRGVAYTTGIFSSKTFKLLVALAVIWVGCVLSVDPVRLTVLAKFNKKRTPTRKIMPNTTKAERKRVELRFLGFMIHSMLRYRSGLSNFPIPVVAVKG